MPLVDQPFAATFAFSRARPAAYRDASGAEVMAPPDTPRFDHAPDGTPRGLLIEGRPGNRQPDRLRAIDGDWNAPKGTVLHEWEDDDGVRRRRAYYAPNDALATVNGCLNVKGRLRQVAYVPTYLANRGGHVRWRNQRWALPGILAVDEDVVLGVSSDIMILEG